MCISIASLCRFKQDILAYVPHDRQWLKDKIFHHIRRQAQWGEVGKQICQCSFFWSLQRWMRSRWEMSGREWHRCVYGGSSVCCCCGVHDGDNIRRYERSARCQWWCMSLKLCWCEAVDWMLLKMWMRKMWCTATATVTATVAGLGSVIYMWDALIGLWWCLVLCDGLWHEHSLLLLLLLLYIPTSYCAVITHHVWWWWLLLMVLILREALSIWMRVIRVRVCCCILRRERIVCWFRDAMDHRTCLLLLLQLILILLRGWLIQVVVVVVVITDDTVAAAIVWHGSLGHGGGWSLRSCYHLLLHGTPSLVEFTSPLLRLLCVVLLAVHVEQRRAHTSQQLQRGVPAVVSVYEILLCIVAEMRRATTRCSRNNRCRWSRRRWRCRDRGRGILGRPGLLKQCDSKVELHASEMVGGLCELDPQHNEVTVGDRCGALTFDNLRSPLLHCLEGVPIQDLFFRRGV